MSQLNVINYDFNKIYSLVKEAIYSCKEPFTEVDNAKFHHNIAYKDLPAVLQYGILSYRKKIEKIENRQLNDNERFIYNDECHVNGIDSVSLSSMEINKNLVSDDEWLYDHEDHNTADIVVSSDVRVVRNRTNYANEFLVDDIVATNQFKAIDFRLLSDNYITTSNEFDRERFIENYNSLRKIAISLKENNLNIPIRERSLEDFNLNVDALETLPELRVK